MAKLSAFVVSSIASWIGWWLGDLFGFVPALILSIIGGGVGIWLGYYLHDRLLDV